MVFAFGCVMAGCGKAEDITGAWLAVEVGGNPVRGPTIAFENGRVSGSGGCNRISGPAATSGSDIKLGPLISTRMFCEGKMEIEAAFIAALEAAKTFELGAEALALKDGSGAALAKFTR